jgi:hypothetical protein
LRKAAIRKQPDELRLPNRRGNASRLQPDELRLPNRRGNASRLSSRGL